MAERKFYWLKLKDNFFRQKEIKLSLFEDDITVYVQNPKYL